MEARYACDWHRIADCWFFILQRARLGYSHQLHHGYPRLPHRPWSLSAILEKQWRLWPVMLFVTWLTVDGCYSIYWHLKDPAALELMRAANFPASLSMYGLCGIIWLYQGSLRQMFSDIKHYPALPRSKK